MNDLNATVTVTYGDKSKSFELEGSELQADDHHRYLGNASKWFIGEEVEKALLELVAS